MKKIDRSTCSIFALLVMMLAVSCQKGDLTTNNNVANSSAIISPSLLLNHITFAMYKGGGVIDLTSTLATSSQGGTGEISEEPWGVLSHYNQYYLSNYSYYQGVNAYNWSNSATHYSDMLKYVVLMENQAAAQNPTAATTNIYAGLGKFFRAYSFIWLAQRVGDIPMAQAASPSVFAPNLTPAYDVQKMVFSNSLKLLDTANTIIGNLIAKNSSANTVVDAAGDIYGFTYLQWQKLINTYKLRVLISLSKRAVDNADLNIPTQFANIINNPTTYPIMAASSDNMVFKYTSVNSYPIATYPYTTSAVIGSTYLNLTTKYKDPRTFKTATPAPLQIAPITTPGGGAKSVSDFTAYVGGDPNLSLAQLLTNSNNNTYSYANYNYYNKTNLTGTVVEPVVMIGYPEMCFNIAEATNRGWITGGDAMAATWYGKGIDASLALYGLTQGQSLAVGNGAGTTVGTVIIDINTFKTNITYLGGTAGLTQILEQKYVAFFQNSGWEAFYNWRRTGVPAFAQGGAGIGTANSLIPRRWQYPLNEQNENTANWQAALQSQFGSTTDDVTKDTWLTK